MNMKKKKHNHNYPKFEFFIYEENFDSRFLKFRNIVENAARFVNNIDTLRSFYHIAKNDNDMCRFLYEKNVFDSNWNAKKDIFELYISVLIYLEIHKYGQEYLPYCYYKVEHQSQMVYRIKISSMKVFKCKDSYAYFSKNNNNFFKYEDIQYELGFTKHAIERFYERCIGNSKAFVGQHLYFLYINSGLKIEKEYITNNFTRKNTVCAAIYRPLFFNIDVDLEIIQRFIKNERVNKSNLYYYKVGYAPIHFDKNLKRAKLSTILLPGMNGTKESEKYKYFVHDVTENGNYFTDYLMDESMRCITSYYLHLNGYKQFHIEENNKNNFPQASFRIQTNKELLDKILISDFVS